MCVFCVCVRSSLFFILIRNHLHLIFNWFLNAFGCNLCVTWVPNVNPWYVSFSFHFPNNFCNCRGLAALCPFQIVGFAAIFSLSSSIAFARRSYVQRTSCVLQTSEFCSFFFSFSRKAHRTMPLMTNDIGRLLFVFRKFLRCDNFFAWRRYAQRFFIAGLCIVRRQLLRRFLLFSLFFLLLILFLLFFFLVFFVFFRFGGRRWRIGRHIHFSHTKQIHMPATAILSISGVFLYRLVVDRNQVDGVRVISFLFRRFGFFRFVVCRVAVGWLELGAFVGDRVALRWQNLVGA